MVRTIAKGCLFGLLVFIEIVARKLTPCTRGAIATCLLSGVVVHFSGTDGIDAVPPRYQGAARTLVAVYNVDGLTRV